MCTGKSVVIASLQCSKLTWIGQFTIHRTHFDFAISKSTRYNNYVGYKHINYVVREGILIMNTNT